MKQARCPVRRRLTTRRRAAGGSAVTTQAIAGLGNWLGGGEASAVCTTATAVAEVRMGRCQRLRDFLRAAFCALRLSLFFFASARRGAADGLAGVPGIV